MASAEWAGYAAPQPWMWVLLLLLLLGMWLGRGSEAIQCIGRYPCLPLGVCPLHARSLLLLLLQYRWVLLLLLQYRWVLLLLEHGWVRWRRGRVLLRVQLRGGTVLLPPGGVHDGGGIIVACFACLHPAGGASMLLLMAVMAVRIQGGGGEGVRC
jgi:hypothetical protein